MEEKTNEIQINIKEFWSVLKSEKWIIIISTFLFGIFGVIYSFSLKEEFVSVGKILPEIQSKGGSIGQFAGLAALAGVDLGGASGGTDAVRPDLYPDILKSTPFFLSLLNEKIRDKFNKETTFIDFYTREVLDGKINESDIINKYPRNDKFISINKQTENNIKDLKERIVCIYDKKVGVISITVKMPDPVVAADVTFLCLNYLTKYIINYRTEKQQRDLDFLVERLNIAKGKYYVNQSKKATYSDKIPLTALRLQASDLQRERIEFEYKTASSFYNSLLQKYEEAKLKMQQETPVIKVLEPPVVSNYKVEPKKSIIVLGFTIFGVVLGIITSLIIKNNYKKFILFG